jgi:hypothetical protein
MLTTRRRFAFIVAGSAAAGLVARVPAASAAAPSADDTPNVFFSPHGRPYRAPPGAPYPVADWFRDADKNGDGKIDRDEFMADAGGFFDVLDLSGQGALGTREIAIYERAIAPEVLGAHVIVLADGRGGARLWLAQVDGPQERPPYDQGPNAYHGPPMGAPDILPGDIQPNSPEKPKGDPDATAGAAPFGLFPVPEPVTSSDPDYVFRGVVRKDRFLDRAQQNFAALDPGRKGYVTLADLPETMVQRMMRQNRRRS